MTMQVITNEFRDAIMTQLDALQEGFYLTRDQVCERIGVDTRYSQVITLVLQEPEFAEKFVSVKSRGIKKISK